MGILEITSISFIVIIKEAQSIQYIHIAERIKRVVIVPRVQFSNPSKAPLFVAFFSFRFISYFPFVHISNITGKSLFW